MHIEVVPYNPQWALDFQHIKSELETYLTGVQIVSIEHVGSTSVPGLAAKPVIDVDVVVRGEENLAAASTALTEQGGYRNMGEMGVTGRVLFREPAASLFRRNLYVCLDGCVALRNHLAVRDACRRDDELRRLYGETKLALASRRDWVDVDEYCSAKNEVVHLILRRAGLSEQDLGEIASHNK